MAAEATPRRRVRFRYTLRALLVFITLLCLWCGYHANLDFKEARAAAVLKRHGAELSYERYGSVWKHLFVSRVRLASSFEPEVVSALASLADVKHLTLSASVPPIMKNPLVYHPSVAKRRPHQKREIRPQGAPPPGAIERVVAGHRLKSLTLDGFQLADADYAQISRHASLEELSIHHTNIPEDALPKLLTLPRLSRFNSHTCEATGKDLASTPGSLSLEVVHCDRTPLGVEFAAFLARCPKLEELSLGHVEVNDDFVTLLENHAGIQMLSLGSTSATEACIPSLERLPSIRCLYLPGDGFSPEGEKRLHTVLNGVDVRFN